MPDLAELVRRKDWWHDLNTRREFFRQWVNVRRQDRETGPAPAPPGYRPCLAPSAGRHVLAPGHVFTDDGRCWVPDER